jgi:hypothetical protein
MNIPTVLVCGILGISACRGITDEGAAVQQIALDFRHLAGAGAAPPDFVSVLEAIRLRTSVNGVENVQTLPLGQSDSTAVFDVSVQDGSVRFIVDVFSNNQTTLYVADTTLAVDADNFAVQIIPRPVNGVLVVWPRTPQPFTTVHDDLTRTAARWLIRNAGSSPLRWNVDSLASDGVLACRVFPQFESCTVPLLLAPSAVPDTVEVVFDDVPAGVNRSITFISSVGDASFATGIP